MKYKINYGERFLVEPNNLTSIIDAESFDEAEKKFYNEVGEHAYEIDDITLLPIAYRYYNGLGSINIYKYHPHYVIVGINNDEPMKYDIEYIWDENTNTIRPRFKMGLFDIPYYLDNFC